MLNRRATVGADRHARAAATVSAQGRRRRASRSVPGAGDDGVMEGLVFRGAVDARSDPTCRNVGLKAETAPTPRRNHISDLAIGLFCWRCASSTRMASHARTDGQRRPGEGARVYAPHTSVGHDPRPSPRSCLRSLTLRPTSCHSRAADHTRESTIRFDARCFVGLMPQGQAVIPQPTRCQRV